MNNYRLAMHNNRLALFTLTFLALYAASQPAQLQSASSTIVISQVYGGGGNAGAIYKNDFIELYNRGAAPVSVTGWSVQYASATGTTWQVTALSGTIQPGRYYLVQEGAGAGGSNNLPPPDATGTINMAAGAGKVALLNTTTAVASGTSCPAGATVIDKVGFGTTTCFEGTGSTPAPTNTTAVLRVRDGLGVEIDTDNNNIDFVAGAPWPGNSSGRGPIGTGTANPTPVPVSASTLLTVAVTPGVGPASTGLAVVANLSAIGGSSTQAFVDDGTNGDVTAGDNICSFEAVIASGTPPGSPVLLVTMSDAQLRSSTTSISLTVSGIVPPSSTLVISQVYGGGGNAGAALTNDFIELYNLGASPVSVSGWSVQYSSAAGTSWQKTDLSGTIPPGRYYLVQEAVGAGGTTPLPTPDAVGTTPMAAASGKIALVSSTTLLTGSCPASSVVDLAGYGTANCSETSPMPALSNTTAGIRKSNGSVDTNNNLNDFSVELPSPHNSSGFPPTGTGLANPASASPGESTLLTVTVTPGQFPSAGGLAVTADVTALGGAANQTFFDDGSNGDAVAHDNVFSYPVSVDASTTIGPKNITATIIDALARQNTASINFAVETPVYAIHDIQGSGSTSSFALQFVTTQGIVTGRKFNGFFLQAPDADADANPATSEGVFVFTGGTPPAAATSGNFVRVSGSVTEFIPSADPVSPPITEVGGGSSAVAVRLLTTANPLPTAVTLTAADTDPAGSREQLERFEGMRVRVDFLRVIAPTQAAFIDEENATSASNGVFYGVVEGLPRPLREPGIELPDALPPGAPCCVPRFDANPERLRVDSDGLVGGLRIEVNAGALVSNLVGPLDYSFRTYMILPDPASLPVVSNLGSAVPVPVPDANEFTVGSFNMERFFDTTEDPAVDDVVLTAAAFETRLKKASLAIRHVMLTPDIIGVEEMENLPTLQAVAARVNRDAVAAGEPNPMYEAYLFEGNDIGGIDSGFLVKRARVIPLDVTQEGKTATFVDPGDGSVDLLNDRPTLVLRAEIQSPLGTYLPVTVLVNHLRSLSGIDGVDGARIRAKRRAQAEFLASLIQTRQAANPAERIVSVGDYNAFQFSDGYVDSIGTIKGTPTAADEVVLASPDLVAANLTNLIDVLPAAERYSFSFDGNGQVLDQMLVNAPMLDRFSRIHFARNDTDFPESFRGDANRPERVSDHDIPVAYFFFYKVPHLILNGANPFTVEAGTTFTDPGATAYDEDLGDLTAQIHVTGSVDANTPGSYLLTYSVTNGVLTTTLTRTVNVIDSVPPLLVLAGFNPMTVEAGTPFVDPGATASDAVAGDLTGAIVVTGVVDTGHVGSYPLTYTVSDGYNSASIERTVIVTDTIPPVLTMLGSNPMTVEAGSPFVDPGATAHDSFAGDLTATIVADGLVDTGHVGTYYRIYIVTDGYNPVSATRVVNVVSTTPPPPPPSQLSRFVAFSVDSTWLRAGVMVFTGDVGANQRRNRGHGHAPVVDDGGRDDVTVRIGDGATLLQPTSRVVGDTVLLINRASVYNVVDNFLLNRRGTILGTVSTPMAIPFLTLPGVPSVLPGSAPVTVARNATVTLAHGSYGVVTVKSGGTLILTGGLYQIQSLALDQRAMVTFRGATQIRIRRTLDTDAKSQLIVDPGVAGLSASQVVIYVAGEDRDCVRDTGADDDGDSAGPAVVHIGSQNVIQANIYAARGTLWLKSKTKATGAFIGQHVRVGVKVELTLDSAF